ncbi:MAG: hypothetical protein ABII96_02950 [Candidatus Zixiibacteriota bacterium]
MKIISFIEDEEAARLLRLSVGAGSFEPWEMKKRINPVIGYQRKRKMLGVSTFDKYLLIVGI